MGQGGRSSQPTDSVLMSHRACRWRPPVRPSLARLDGPGQEPSFSFQPLPLTNIPYEKAIQFLINSSQFPGVVLESGYQRQYIKGDLESLSHVMGYTGKISDTEYTDLRDKGYLMTDYVGKIGIEYTYEKELRGIYGKKNVEVDALGKEIKIIAQDDPIKGHDVYLSIDLEIQEKLEEALSESYLKSKEFINKIIK